MTILTMNRKELEGKIGKITKETEEKIILMGTPVEEVKASEISVEIFPNRPDLLSLQGFSRSLLQYLGKKSPCKFKVNKPDKNYKIKIEKSVKKVRPHTACAIIKGLKLNNEKIKEIIDIQEKLHNTIGRKRKKIAIGIYPLEKIKLPIRFTAKKPQDIKFIPLEMNKELTGAQILRQHPAGRDYAHLLENAQEYPVFIDSENKILSMPPIINSKETGKISEKTKNIFIECSGFNLEYLKKALNILVTAFSDMGGKIYSMNIEDSKSFISPNLEKEELEFKIKDINKTLGLELTEKEVKRYLEKMGIGFKKQKSKQELIALIPAYRTDILHWIDLAEEVAIAYGYDNFNPEIPNISTIGEEDKKSTTKKIIATILAGLGLLEVSSYHVCTKKDIKKIHFDFKDFIEIQDSKTEYNTLRIDLLTNLLKIFSENINSQYPQKIFELGRVFEKDSEQEKVVKETEKLAIAITDEKINFTELKQVLDYLFKMINKEYKIQETENPNFIRGRAGKIISDNKEIGIIGEISPRVLNNWKLKMPVSALEINLDFILS
jgi:phenylalanyl-tRNA synthetase beta chain